LGEHLNRRLGLPAAAALCALAIGMFFLATIREGHVWGDDFSLYIRHAQNIVRGEPYAESGYIYNPQNPLVGPKIYPPGFPLLLAPVVGVFGLELRPMKILVIAFFVGSLLVMIPLFRRVATSSPARIPILSTRRRPACGSSSPGSSPTCGV